MTRFRAALVTLMAAALTVSGCDTMREAPLAPEMTGTSAQFSQGGAVRWGLARAQFRQQGDYTSAMIGPNGGWLSLGGHFLEVRPGAVSSPTRFVMAQRDGEHFVLDLHASRANGQVISVFPPNTVFLYMTYRNAVLSDGSRFGIAYIPTAQSDQTIVPLQVQTYADWMLVRANLLHFSTYALIVD